MDYFLSYCLGIKKPSGPRTETGSITHKGWELYGRARLAEQEGVGTFVEPETERVWKVEDLSVDSAIEFAAPLYPGGDRYDAHALLTKLLTDNHGEWHPGNHHVVAPELFFDQELSEPWARYEFPDPNGGPPIKGRLRIRGTMDLLVRDENGQLLYGDLKTGRPFYSWAKGRLKTWSDLMEDDQLLLYHKALRTVAPGEWPVMAIVYVREGGGVSYLPYGEEQVEKCDEMLETVFKEISECQMPARRMDEPGGGPKKQPCSFCAFSKLRAPTGDNLCDFYHKELVTLGMTRCVAKHAADQPYLHYSEGGGKKHAKESA